MNTQFKHQKHEMEKELRLRDQWVKKMMFEKIRTQGVSIIVPMMKPPLVIKDACDLELEMTPQKIAFDHEDIDPVTKKPVELKNVKLSDFVATKYGVKLDT